MGATITISLLPPSNDSQEEYTAEQLLDDVFELLNIYNQRFNANDANSELMQVNHAAGKHPVPVDPELFELIQIGKEQSIIPASHLNISLGPLVQAWRIGFADARIPNNAEVAHALSLTDPQLIELDPLSCTVFLAKEGMKLDLGCLAKGYIADKMQIIWKVSTSLLPLLTLAVTLRQLETMPLRIGRGRLASRIRDNREAPTLLCCPFATSPW